MYMCMVVKFKQDLVSERYTTPGGQMEGKLAPFLISNTRDTGQQQKETREGVVTHVYDCLLIITHNIFS